MENYFNVLTEPVVLERIIGVAKYVEATDKKKRHTAGSWCKIS